MATERTAMMPDGTVIFLDENKDTMTPSGVVISEQDISAGGGFQTAWARNSNQIIGTSE